MAQKKKATAPKLPRAQAIEELANEMERMMTKALHPKALVTYLEGNQFNDDRATLTLQEWTNKARLALYGDGTGKRHELLRERLEHVREYNERVEGELPDDVFGGFEYELSIAHFFAGVLWGHKLAGASTDEVKRTCRSIFEAYE